MTLKYNKNSLLVPQEQNRLCDYFYGSYIGFGAGGGVEADLTVGNAVILNDGDSANFSRTNATPTDLNKWTYSTWVKRGTLGTRQTWGLSVFTSSTASYMQFHNAGSGSFDTIYLNDEGVSGTSAILRTNAEFRDPNAWYHIVNIYDTDNATEALRFRLFVNGVEITDFATDTIPSSGATSAINTGSATQYLGRQAGSSNYFDGYLAQCVFCDGQAYTPDNFGKFNSNGVWVPKKVSTLTFGDNGFYLDFADSSDLGKDVSGKGNDFTANNFASSDQTTDSPTLNWCTLTPAMSEGGGTVSLSEGNLAVAGTEAVVWNNAGASFGGFSSGKWVWCAKPSTSGAGHADPWVVNQDGWKHMQESDATTHYAYIDADGFEISFDTASVQTPLTNGGSRSLSHTYGSDDMHLVAMDFDNNKLWFGVYDDSADTTQWIGTSTSYDGDPANGTNPTFTLDTPPYYWGVATYTGRNGVVDFGQGTLLDQITIPTGFKKLNSDNLPTPTVPDPTAGFQAITYLGTGANQTITMGGNSYGHRLGSGDRSSLITVTTSGGSWSGTMSQMVNGSTSNGPGISSYADEQYVQFQFPEAVNITEVMIVWQSSGSNVGDDWRWFGSNNGSDWTTLSGANDLNPNPAVSVLSLGSIGANDTYSYYRFKNEDGSGANSVQWRQVNFRVKPTDNDRAVSTFQPDFVMIKNRDTTDEWSVYDAPRGVTKHLNTGTSQETTDADTLTAFNSTGFALGDDDKVNTAGERYVAYCWRAGGGAGSSNTTGSINTTSTTVDQTYGFSISTYEGNATSGATFGHGLGKVPKMIWIKPRDATEGWIVYHVDLGGTKGTYLNMTNTSYTGTYHWNDTNPSSTVVTLGDHVLNNGSGNNMVALCWAPIEGFSDFGTYKGNGSANGSLVFTGFRPAFVLIKNNTSAGSWHVYDSTRSHLNEVDDQLVFESSTAETTGSEEIDFLSNGFKCRTSDAGINSGSSTYLYAAWAESPFGGRGGVAGLGVTPARAV